MIDITQVIFDYYRASQRVLWFVTTETTRIYKAASEAADLITESNKEYDEPPCHAISHNRAAGFFDGQYPPITTNNGSGEPESRIDRVFANALQLTEMNHLELLDAHRSSLPISPLDNAIFVFENADYEILGNALDAQVLRNIITRQEGDYMFASSDEDHGDRVTIRGGRMNIIVTSSVVSFPQIPELHPIVIPLPGEDMLREVCDATIGAYASSKQVSLDDRDVDRIIKATSGMTVKDAEDAMSLATIKANNVSDVDAIINHISFEKKRHAENIRGVRMVDASQIDPTPLPGFDLVTEFFKERTGISLELARKHNLKPVKGVLLAGLPGTGKSSFAMQVAKFTGTDLVFLSLGEVQGSLVGESEKNIRTALDFIHSRQAVAIIDDADKVGLSAAKGGSSGDSGTFGRILETLLTTTASSDFEGVVIFTGNRIRNMPPELIRAGRVDERFYVQEPCSEVRLEIIKHHANNHNITIEGELDPLGKATEKFVGAELAQIVSNATFQSLARGDEHITVNQLIKQVARTTPLLKQQGFQADLQEMKDHCQQFVHVGRQSQILRPKSKSGNRF